MKLINTIIFLLFANISIGQVLFNETYIKSDWDYATAVIERQDGKYLIAGSSRSQFGNDFDVNVLLIDSAGNIIWDKYLGIFDTLEFANSIIETSDTNYIISGRKGNYFPYVMKFDSNGNLIWEKKYSNGVCCHGGFSIGESIDSAYFFVRQSFTFNFTTFYKINLLGDTLWTKHYDSLICHSVIQTTDSGFALIGSGAFMNDRDIKFYKTNSIGDTLWTKTYGGNGRDGASSIQQLPDNGFIIAGTFDTQIPDGEPDTYIIRTNFMGDTIWTKRYANKGTPGHIKKCNNNDGYIFSSTRYIPGWFPSDDEHYILITKIDTLGNIQWSRQFDGSTYQIGNNIAQTSDGNFLLTGHKEDYYNSPNKPDMILIKIDSIGNYVLSVFDFTNSNILRALAYPNPANNIINFQFNSLNGMLIKQVKIFNSLGQELSTMNDINETKFTTNVEMFAEGIYFFEITSTGSHIATGKFIVKE